MPDAAEKKRKLPPALQSGLAISNDAAAVPQAAKRNRMGDRRGFGRKICPEPSYDKLGYDKSDYVKSGYDKLGYDKSGCLN